MEIINIFKDLTKVARCSGIYEPFIDYICNIAKEYKYDFIIDDTKNILISKGSPKICLQAHYDIVCIGTAKQIEIYEEDGFLKASNHTLGADNGMAIAYMVSLMKEGYDLELLLTSDEEIGLIGANGLQLDVKADFILNLDTEEDGYIYIGCAGGSNVDGFLDLEFIDIEIDDNIYKVQIDGLSGGHSGVDIDKNIDNAIVVLLDKLKDTDFELISINGGQRDNSIPTSCEAIICSKNALEFEKLDKKFDKKIKNSKKIIKFLSQIKHGILSKDENMVQSSQNLAIVKTEESQIKIVVSQRAMSNETLTLISDDLISLFEINNFRYTKNGKYPAWKPEKNKFTDFVYNIYIKHYENVEYKTIHAGLECGVLLEKYPNKLIASIGPNIYNPHSIYERVDIKSTNRVFDVVKDIIDSSRLI
jgi:dipeptidase D